MNLCRHLQEGHVIPAQPLALDAQRKLSERHQRAITRYYVASGVGGLAVGVHSTQFEIRGPRHGLFKPVLELAARTVDEELSEAPRPFIKIAGLCGRTEQALAEAEIALGYGYQAGLLSMGAYRNDTEEAMLTHCARIAAVIPVIGFYLQPSAGGRLLSHSFWRKLADIPNVIAIKMAPFNRYQTIDVVRAVVESGRDDLALYTGNDDNIVVDLFTPFTFEVQGKQVIRRIEGGLLGHWGVWTHAAVNLLHEIKVARKSSVLDMAWLDKAISVTDMNAALFDSANGYVGAIPGILEVLRRQGLVPTINTLNPQQVLSPGQAEELDRVCRAYPSLIDDDFVATNRDKWLA